ncbi:RNA-binding protein 28 [Selaginella moellendorffii]|uniref:RNA-binding protein 28 n=1 Tax=Selaginella moellendorffii TaxID=88036 RepID=UPI000D1CBBF0|nr:RNA-binding protein 28 [Selaginella moellendorffii]|eukprot:XP_024539975.1 RNA-binding protein 28 [Selaginella moellendorffii]
MGDEKEAKRENEIDARTVFVRGLPLTLSDAQLEEAFSDIGPVRRAFTVKDKATNKHRGFGFVQFAIAEDAQRAVASKNDSSMEGRRIKVEVARKRPSLNERRKKRQGGTTEAAGQENAAEAANNTVQNGGEKEPETPAVINEEEKPKQGTAKSHAKAKCKRTSQVQETTDSSQNAASEKQRPARTVVIGNLGDSETAEAVLTLAKKLGTVESVEKSLSEAYINQHGLSRDGCKLPAAAIVFTSVTAARQAVATYHLQKLGNEVFWARQLGGEGSKLKKWRLIVRNLPFKVTDAMLKEKFSAAGFVWETTVPRNPDGRSKGFAFIGYTCKNDAEKAIKALNGTKIANRTIAVDWAVAKMTYENIVHKSEEEKAENSDLDNETASESDGIVSDEEEDEEDEEDDEEDDEEEEKPLDEKNLVSKVLSKVVTEPGKAKDGDEDRKSPMAASREVKKPLAAKPPEENSMERTLFVRNLPPDAKVHDLKKKFSEFGDVTSLRLVLHPATKKPKGTAFVEFATREAAEALARATKNAEEGNSSFSIAGKYPIAHFAVDRDAAREISTKKSIEERDHDKRNLHLLKEGYIQPGTEAAHGVSKSDLLKRSALQTEKATKLRSPNFHVSKTRLAIHNFPRTLSEKDVKQLFTNAVVSRARKQRPVIKQVKLLTDDKENSRGTGFVEFAEHQHAIVALRVLNNNPETFGSEKRPIVEFAIENVARMKKRESRLAAQKLRPNSKGPTSKRVDDTGNGSPGGKRKRQPNDDGVEADGRKSKRKKRKGKNDKAQNGESNQGQGNQEKPLGKKRDKAQNGGGEQEKPQGGADKQGKAQGKKRKMDKAQTPAKPHGKKGFKQGEGAQRENLAAPDEKKRRRGKNEGNEEEDKLDRLVSEYRKKYFSNVGTGEGAKNLSRWYEE